MPGKSDPTHGSSHKVCLYRNESITTKDQYCNVTTGSAAHNPYLTSTALITLAQCQYTMSVKTSLATHTARKPVWLSLEVGPLSILRSSLVVRHRYADSWRADEGLSRRADTGRANRGAVVIGQNLGTHPRAPGAKERF